MAMASLTLHLMVLSGQLHSLAKPPGPLPLSSTRIKEHQSHDISAVYEHCQATGHNINPHNVKVLPDENNTIKSRVKKAIAIKQRNPPWIWMRDWTYQQFTILPWGFCYATSHLTMLMTSELFGRNIRLYLGFSFWVLEFSVLNDDNNNSNNNNNDNDNNNNINNNDDNDQCFHWNA